MPTKKTTKKSTTKKSTTKKSTAKKTSAKKTDSKKPTDDKAKESKSVASISTATSLNPDIIDEGKSEEVAQAPSTTGISESDDNDTVVAKSGLPTATSVPETKTKTEEPANDEVPEDEKLASNAFSDEVFETEDSHDKESEPNLTALDQPETQKAEETVNSTNGAAKVVAAMGASQAAQVAAAKELSVDKKEVEAVKEEPVVPEESPKEGASPTTSEEPNDVNKLDQITLEKSVTEEKPNTASAKTAGSAVTAGVATSATSMPLDTSSKVDASTSVNISNGGNNNDNYSIEKTEKKSHKKTMLISLILLIILIIIGGAFYYFQNKGDVVSPIWMGGDEVSNEEVVDPSKSYENPINGLQYSQSEAGEFKDRKPVAVMVNNHVVARPSSGLSKADIIYEAVAEGGITRLMPVFYSQSPENVSSIRSARYYFVELASAYSPHYIHWGAAYVPDCQLSAEGCSHGQIETQPDVDAKARIVQLGVPNIDVGGFETDCSIDNDNCFVSRDPERVESMGKLHAGFVKYDLIFDRAKDMRPEDSWNEFTPITEWKFKDDAPLEERGTIGQAKPITYSYWESQPDFNVKWVYNPETNTYLRYQGGQKQVDMETGEDLEAKVVIVRFTEQEPAGDYKNHLRHQLVGTGDALVFQDGEVKKVTWTRSTHDQRDIYTDEDGNQIEFVRGQIWVQLVPTGNNVSYGQLEVVESTISEDDSVVGDELDANTE